MKAGRDSRRAGGRPARAADGARVRAVEALRKVLESGRPAAPLVGELSRGLSPPDADLLRELVLGVLRWKASLDAEIAAVSRIPLQKLAPNLREILEVALYQLRHLDRIPPYAAVSEAVTHARASGGEGASKLVNGVLRGILLLPAPVEPRGRCVRRRARAVLTRIPPFSSSAGWPASGRRRRGACSPPTTRPRGSTCSRIPRRTTRDALVSALAAEGVEAVRSPLTPLGLTAVAGNPLRSPPLPRRTLQRPGSGRAGPAAAPASGRAPRRPRRRAGRQVDVGARARARARDARAGRFAPRRLRRVAENARRLEAAARPVGRRSRVPAASGGTVRPGPSRRALQRDRNAPQESRDPLPRDAGSDRAAGREAGALARGGGGAPRARRLAALLDVQPRARGERAGRRARLRARAAASRRRRSSRSRVWRRSSRAPGCGSCRTTASTGSRRTFCGDAGLAAGGAPIESPP